MSISLLASSRLLLPSIPSRTTQTCRTLVSRALTRPVPPPRPEENITTPTEFLTKIGRESETKYEAPETWRQFWRFTDGLKLRKDGLAVKDRRYILWCMERFRLGHAVVDFAHKPKPPKTIRGWGPIVQKGRRIRSKRRKQAPSDEKRRP